jgi:cytochrome c
MVNKGKTVFEKKCISCHSLGGPANSASDLSNGLSKRKPEWIMNMTYNPTVAVWANASEEAKLKQCYTRQPGQALTIEESRDFIELLRTFQEEQ